MPRSCIRRRGRLGKELTLVDDVKYRDKLLKILKKGTAPHI